MLTSFFSRENAGTTVSDYTQMNALVDKFGSKLLIVGFPCEQFGHQEAACDSEIRNCLRHARPGNGFEAKFSMMKKADVNGFEAQPIFKYLRAALPYPEDRTPELDIEQPYGAMKDSQTTRCLWTPKSPNDVMWNFEKFILDKNGVPRHRFSPKFATEKLAPFIEALLKE